MPSGSSHAPAFDPLHQGFDSDVPHTPSPGPVGGYLAPWKFWPSQGSPGEHIEDRMAEEASSFILAHKDKPFYLNYWAFSVHCPWNAKRELIEKYRANPVMTSRCFLDAFERPILYYRANPAGVQIADIQPTTGQLYGDAMKAVA